MKVATGVLLCLVLITAAEAADALDTANLTHRIQQTLEDQFRSSTGLGFASFDCDLPEDGAQPRELTCQAVDEEGDQFFYRIMAPEDDQEPVVTTFQPVSQLNPSGLELIERPCVAFLNAFDAGDWAEAHNELSTELQTRLTTAELGAFLGPVRQVVGELQSTIAELYTTPSADLHGVEYALKSDGGEAVARFRLRIVEGEQARIVAFLVSAKPGSQLQAELLSQSGIEVLSPLFGQSVTKIEAPLEQLELIGDSVEGLAWLDNGEDYAIRVEQHHSAYDLDGNDYRFQVLDVPWLVRRYLLASGEAPREVNCPSRLVPDGNRIDCVASLEDGSERPVSLVRAGGDYRLVK